MGKKCPVSGCPADRKPWEPRLDPNCQCGKPIWIVVRPGEHIHPCPVHPGYVVYGNNVRCR